MPDGLRLRQRSVPYLKTAERARHEFDGPWCAEMSERISVLQVDDNFRASRAERDAAVQEVALRRPQAGQVGRSSVAGATEATSLDDALAPGARLRLQGHRRVAQGSQVSKRDGAR